MEAGFEMVEGIPDDPDLERLHGDPRFEEIVDRVLGGGSAEYPPLTFETLDVRMEAEAAGGFTGSVLVVRNGEIVLSAGYGSVREDSPVPASPTTVYGIGSTPIDFTKAGILWLAQNGKLDLNAPITEFFGDVPEDKRAITIEHLMTGASGLPDFHDRPSDADPDLTWIDREEAVRRILESRLLFTPGEGDEHSTLRLGAPRRDPRDRYTNTFLKAATTSLQSLE